MKQLSWSDITVQQFQSIHRLALSRDLDDMARAECAITILYNMTEHDIDNLPLTEFNRLAKECAFVLGGEDGIPGKPVRQIKIGKRRYSIIHKPTKLVHRQYVEVLHFGDKPIENMHLIMASIVEPVTWYGRKLKNDADQHEAIAADMLKAKIVDVYHTCVFFCKLYINLIETIKPYLIHEMMTKGATMEQAKILLNTSQNVMRGFITHERLQLSKV